LTKLLSQESGVFLDTVYIRS